MKSTIWPVLRRPIHYQIDPVQTTKVNVHGAINMLGLAKRLKPGSCRHRRAKLTVTRTSTPRRNTTGGTSILLAARSCYDEGKRCAETLFSTTIASTRLEIKVARIFNTYGPRDAPQRRSRRLEFHRAGPTGEAITLYGDGSQTRSFCYVDDLVEGSCASCRRRTL